MSRNPLHDLVVRATVGGALRKQGQTARKAVASAYKLFSKGAEKMQADLASFARTVEIHDAEVASWREPGEIVEGEANPVDACDLRHWLMLAERAGVPFIPARQILSLTEDEFGAVSGSIQVPPEIANRVRAKMAQHGLPTASESPQDEVSARDVFPRLFDAMDDVPANWMVRSHLAGGSILKGLAGTGTMEDANLAIEVGPDVKVGPGFIHSGNRRAIDVTDNRIMTTFAGGHKETIHFLARPWIEASRFEVADDPHRHGSVYAGKGRWPAEWRVFVENGQVIGVSSYYAWAGEGTPEAAHHALETVAAAEKIIAEAKRLRMQPRLMDIEFLRAFKKMPEVTERWAADGIHCTLDFIETDEGPKLLEGGPAHTMVGGAFPCAFAGHGMRKETGLFCRTEGVALRLMDHINLAEPNTWRPGPVEGRILSWEEARDLAAQFGAAPAP